MRRKHDGIMRSEAEADLVAIQGDLTLAERAELFHMNSDQIQDWLGKGLNDADEVFDRSAGQEKDDLSVPAQRRLVDFFFQPYAAKMGFSHTKHGTVRLSKRSSTGYLHPARAMGQ